MKKPFVEILMLNWNGRENTLECLHSVIKTDYGKFHITVIDNDSKDGSIEAISNQFPDVNVIRNPRNLGYAEGYNVGLRYALAKGADYTLVMNNDTLLDPGAVSALVDVAESDDKIGIVSGKVYYYDCRNVFQSVGLEWSRAQAEGRLIGLGEGDIGQYDEIAEREYVDDVFMLVRRSVIETTGGYNKNFFLYFEETDWNARVRSAGFRIMYTPHAKIWHKGMSSTGGNLNPKYYYYFTRNRILFTKRNYPGFEFLRFLLKQFSWEIPRTTFRFARRRELRNLSGYSRGWVSGLAWLVSDGNWGEDRPHKKM